MLSRSLSFKMTQSDSILSTVLCSDETTRAFQFIFLLLDREAYLTGKSRLESAGDITAFVSSKTRKLKRISWICNGRAVRFSRQAQGCTALDRAAMGGMGNGSSMTGDVGL